MKWNGFLKKISLQKIIVVFVILSFFALCVFRVLAVTKVYRDKNNLEEDIAEYLNSNGFSGIILVAKGEEIKYIEAFGESSEGKEFSVNTVMPIFSLTKQFTAHGILLLEQEGKLSRTDKLSKYFDNCKYGDEVTIAELLDMTAGIPEYVGNADIFSDPEDNSVYLSEVDPDEFLEKILNLDLDMEARGEYHYSNSNYYLLGVIIEQVSDMEYEEFIKKNVTDPAGIKRISFDPQATESKGYTISETDGSKQFGEEFNHTITFSAGSLCTTASNLYRWEKYLFSDRSKVDIRAKFEEVGDGYNFGLAKHGTVYEHSGGGLYHRLLMTYDTADDTQIIVMSNSKNCDDHEITNGLNWVLFGK